MLWYISQKGQIKKKIVVTSKTDEAIEQDHSDIGGDDLERDSHPGK